jgi:hypothetical protein
MEPEVLHAVAHALQDGTVVDLTDWDRHRQVISEYLWLSRCEWTVRRNVVADCVFHAAAAAVISCQTAKRLVISCRHWGALIR